MLANSPPKKSRFHFWLIPKLQDLEFSRQKSADFYIGKFGDLKNRNVTF